MFIYVQRKEDVSFLLLKKGPKGVEIRSDLSLPEMIRHPSTFLRASMTYPVKLFRVQSKMSSPESLESRPELDNQGITSLSEIDIWDHTERTFDGSIHWIHDKFHQFGWAPDPAHLTGGFCHCKTQYTTFPGFFQKQPLLYQLLMYQFCCYDRFVNASHQEYSKTIHKPAMFFF